MTETRSIQRKLVPVPSFAAEPEIASMKLSEGKLRWLIYNREKNGFSRCLRKVGGRLFIDVGEFFEWVDHQSTPEVRHESR